MKEKMRFISILLALILILSSCGKGTENVEDKDKVDENSSIKKEDTVNNESLDFSGSQKIEIKGFDWGPGVIKTIITLDKEIDSNKLNKEDFTIIEKKESFDWEKFEKEGEAPEHIIVESPRTVEDVYICDENGEKIDGEKSKNIAIETKATPDEGNPFIYSMNTGFNNWCDPYEQHISVDSNDYIASFEIDPKIDLSDDSQVKILGIEKFDYGEFTASDGKKLTYADYKPEEDGKKKALVIWLHGAGEGGSDPRIPILANRAAAFADDSFQNLFEGGAYYLVPQTPTFWMDIGGGQMDESIGNKQSIYNLSLKELIDNYVEENPDIDPKRIIIGGCSNGGFMTYDMIMEYSDYFAAGFPVCPPYEAKNVTDEKLSNIKDIPIWVIYAANDDTVDPKTNEETMNELFKNTDMKDYRVTVFDDVHDSSGEFKDEDGNPYQYNGHWSWIYVYNDEVVDENGTRLFDWISEQSN